MRINHKGEMEMSLEFGTKKLGFGTMRPPMASGTLADGGTVDIEQFTNMVDLFLARGFCYFDTARSYIKGKNESIVREALVKRHPRESFILTDKLTTNYFEKEEDLRPLFQQQLEACGVEYFDYYLLHCVTAETYQKFLRCNAFEFLKEVKETGKARHIGFSFHDRPELLEEVLSAHPEVDVVQIQLNYIDYEDSGVQSRAVYEVCQKHGKPVIVMEPVKGGNLANLPEEAGAVLDALNGGSHASYAVRFAASHEGVAMVLSGMSSLEQMEDNLSYMENFQPLNQQEREALDKVCEIMRSQSSIPCTGCSYCVAGCPMNIAIPDLFACYNSKQRYKTWNAPFYYSVSTGGDHGKASDCIACGQCEQACPQHLPIPALMKDVAAAFES